MKKTVSLVSVILLVLILLMAPVLAAMEETVTPDEANILIAPAEVWVSNDYDASTPGWNSTHFDNLADAAAGVAAHGVIYVDDGTYGSAEISTNGIQIIGSDNSILDGTGLEVAAGLNITGTGVTVDNLTFVNWNGYDDTAGAGIYLTGANTADETTITNCVFTDNHYGIRGWSKDNIIENNLFTDSYYHAVDLTSDGNILRGNQIDDSLFSGLYITGNRNAIQDNNLTGNNVMNAYTWLGAINVIGNYNTISGNQAVHNGRIGIYITGNHNTISGNTASFNGQRGGWRGIHLYGSHNDIENNTINGNNSAGLEISSSAEFPSTENRISGNTVMSNRDTGIYVRAGVTIVSSNRSSDNGRGGLRIQSSATGSLISGNIFDDNGDYGVDSRGGNQIIGNTIRNNERPDLDYAGGGISAGVGDVVRFNNISGNKPHGVMTWLGVPETGSISSEPEAVDTRNNWWGHPDGPTVVEIILPPAISTSSQTQGDNAAGMLISSPYLQSLAVHPQADVLTVGKQETLIVSLLNNHGEAVGNSHLSVRISVVGAPDLEDILVLSNGQATFSYRRNSPGSDTIHLSLLVAGELTGLEAEQIVAWVVGEEAPPEEPPVELPHTGSSLGFIWASLLMLSTGLVLKKHSRE